MTRRPYRRYSGHRLHSAGLPLLFAAFMVAGEASAGDLTVTAATFDAQVIDASMRQPVIVEFYADWCGNCHRLRPIMEALAEEYAGRLHFVRVDVEAEPEIAERLQLDGVPVVYAFDLGLPLSRITGPTSRAELKEMLDGFVTGP